jgi:hypothetical protein
MIHVLVFNQYDVFEEESQNLKRVFAVRWRLEPKMLKMLKNKRGTH